MEASIAAKSSSLRLTAANRATPGSKRPRISRISRGPTSVINSETCLTTVPSSSVLAFEPMKMPTPGRNLDDAKHLQGRHGLSQGRPANVQLLGQLAFGGKPVPDPNPAFLDQGEDSIHYFRIDACGSDRLQQRRVLRRLLYHQVPSVVRPPVRCVLANRRCQHQRGSFSTHLAVTAARRLRSYAICGWAPFSQGEKVAREARRMRDNCADEQAHLTSVRASSGPSPSIVSPHPPGSARHPRVKIPGGEGPRPGNGGSFTRVQAAAQSAGDDFAGLVCPIQRVAGVEAV